jgi:hypothetical protein
MPAVTSLSRIVVNVSLRKYDNRLEKYFCNKKQNEGTRLKMEACSCFNREKDNQKMQCFYCDKENHTEF